MGKQIPLYGLHVERYDGSTSKGLTIKSSDCSGVVPPTEASKKHEELQKQIDCRKVPDGEQVGWIEVDGYDVVGHHIDDCLL